MLMSDFRPPTFRPSFLAGRKQFDVPLAEIDRVRLRLAESGISFTCIWRAGVSLGAIEVNEAVPAEVIAGALGDGPARGLHDSSPSSL